MSDGRPTCPRCYRQHELQNVCPLCGHDYYQAFVTHLDGKSAQWVGVLRDWWRPYEPMRGDGGSHED